MVYIIFVKAGFLNLFRGKIPWSADGRWRIPFPCERVLSLVEDATNENAAISALLETHQFQNQNDPAPFCFVLSL